MSYQWGPQGPAFEFHNTYGVENRFFTLRAGLLLLAALVILWFALAEPDPSPRLLFAQRGEPTAHVLLACLLLVLGVIDLITVVRRRRVALVPGQPASLTSDLVRQGKANREGVSWLVDVMHSGRVPTPDLSGPYRGLLEALAPRSAAGPACVRDYLGLRLAHICWALGLMLALLLTWALVRQPPTLALATLWYSGVTAALVARSAWISRMPPSPLALVIFGVLSALVGLLLGWFGGALPAIWRLVELQLPLATLGVLLCLLVIEGLAFLAGRVPVDELPRGGLGASEAQAEVAADHERVMQEVERELHSYWTEGIANRRHAWRVALAEADAGDETGFSAQLLEESQPVQPGERRAAEPVGAGARRRWLLALSVLGLLLTLAGAALWVMLVFVKMDKPLATTWATAPISVVLIVAGGYALRIGHLLWGRLEVESMLIGVDARAALPQQPVQLRWRVVRARSVFYADAPHVVGNRTLLELTGDEATAKRSVQQVRSYAERAARAGDDRGPVPTPGLARPVAPGAVAPRPPPGRFCSACGTPVLQGARFCQSCGTALSQA